VVVIIKLDGIGGGQISDAVEDDLRRDIQCPGIRRPSWRLATGYLR